MNIQNLVRQNRSYRRFRQDHALSDELLRDLVDLARLAPCGGNNQPLKYAILSEPGSCERLFPHLAWAGYLKDWSGPELGERPAGYIVILGDKEISRNVGCDHGIAAQTILLGAVEQGLGGCLLGAIDREAIRTEFKIDERFDILLVAALGKPKEEVVLDSVGADGSIRYWRDANQVHHVPKRTLDDILVPLK